MKEFIKPYLGYALGYVSFRISSYLLNNLFSMVAEIIDTDNNAENNNNELIDGTNGIVTTHDYNTCKEVVNIITIRGGQNGLLPRGAGGVIQESFQHLGKFCKKGVSIILRPIAKSLGFVLLKIPMLKDVYKAVKTVRVIIASSLALATMRLIARFDYWTLILGDASALISVDQKAALAGIRRMRMGMMHMEICASQTNEIINLASDEDVNLLKKENMLINLFSMYEFLPENHPFKNRYFASIIHLLLGLFIYY